MCDSFVDRPEQEKQDRFIVEIVSDIERLEMENFKLRERLRDMTEQDGGFW